jgi:hypothetical protein
MDIDDVLGRPLALVVVTDDVGDDWGMWVGSLERRGDRIIFVYPDGTKRPLREEHLRAVRPVPDELKDVVVGAEWMLPVRAGQ